MRGETAVIAINGPAIGKGTPPVIRYTVRGLDGAQLGTDFSFVPAIGTTGGVKGGEFSGTLTVPGVRNLQVSAIADSKFEGPEFVEIEIEIESGTGTLSRSRTVVRIDDADYEGATGALIVNGGDTSRSRITELRLPASFVSLILYEEGDLTLRELVTGEEVDMTVAAGSDAFTASFPPLADGEYQLKFVTESETFTYRFHALLGDADGDRIIGGQDKADLTRAFDHYNSGVRCGWRWRRRSSGRVHHRCLGEEQRNSGSAAFCSGRFCVRHSL